MTRKISNEELALLPPERQKVILHDRSRSKKNQEKNRIRNKEYYEKNKEYAKNKQREWNKNNKETISKYNKNKAMTFVGKKQRKVDNWKREGFKHTPEEFDIIYERYHEATECELCSKHVVTGSNDAQMKCADHHHLSGSFRNIVCVKCNNLRASQDITRMKMLLELRRIFVYKYQ